MIRNKNVIIGFLLGLFLSPTIATIVFAASSFQLEADEYLNRICNKKKVVGTDAVLCYFRDRLNSLESSDSAQNKDIADLQVKQASNSAEITDLKSRKAIVDIGQVRGSFWENSDSFNNVVTPDQVTVNCPKACNLWVNYDVDTRNTSAPFQHLYMIYVDGVDQAVFNQATMTTPNAAIPLAVNGVFLASVGTHTVSIYARTYGGIMQSHESHLQVLAIEQ